MKLRENLPIAILGVCIAILPIVMSSATLDPVLAIRFASLTVTVALVSFVFTFYKGETQAVTAFIKSQQSLAFYIFLLLALASSFYAINKVEALYTIGKDLLFFFYMLLLIKAIGSSINRILFIVKCFIVAAFIIVAFGAMQLIQVFSDAVGNPDLYIVRSTLGHRNLLVSALILLAPFLVFGVYRFKKFWMWFSLLTLLTAATLIILLESRTAWLAAGAFGMVILAISVLLKTRLQTIKLPLRYIALGFALVVMIAFTVFYTTAEEIEPNAELTSGLGFSNPSIKDFTTDERLFMWEATTRMISDHSPIGVGPGNWRIWFPKYGSDIWRSRQGLAQFQRPHNDYLWVLAEQGIVGLIAYLFMFFGAIFCALQLILSKAYNKNISQLLGLLVAGIVGYLIVAFFSFPRERIIHQMVLYGSFALIFSLYFNRVEVRGHPKKWQMASWLIFLLSGVLVIMSYQRWKGEIGVNKMLYARSNIQWSEMLREYDRNESFYFFNLDPTSVPMPFYGGLAKLSLEQYSAAEADMLEAYAIHPYNIHVVNNLANVYQLSGDKQKAIEFYKKALEISPKYLDGALNLIAAYFNANQVEQSYNLLKQYHKLFMLDGLGDERYQQYLIIVMNTARDNLMDSIEDEQLAESLAAIGDEGLYNIHQTNLNSSASIQEILLSEAKKTLKGTDILEANSK